MIKIQEGMRLKVVKGEQNYYGKDKHSPNAQWIAGSVPVGTVGTVYKAQIGVSGWMYALNFDGITPKEGYIFGLGSSGDDGESLEEVKE